MKNLLLLLSLSAIILTFSCKKDSGICDDCIEKNATVIEYGCTWAIQFEEDGLIEDTYPNNLASTFLQDDLKVKVIYKPTSEFYVCGFLSIALKEIELIEIQEL